MGTPARSRSPHRKPDEPGSPGSVVLPELKPIIINVPDVGDMKVIGFYAPGSGVTPVDTMTGGGPFGNFWGLEPHTITVTHNGVSGTFTNSEAAYQCMKWWQDASTRKQFEDCSQPGLEGGQQSYYIKKGLEKTSDPALQALAKTDFDGLGKFGGMVHVLRQKWRLPGFKEFLLSTKGWFLVEHCPLKGRDPYWTDDFNGGGQNRLGAALMKVREELLKEADESADGGWPAGVQRPSYVGGDKEGLSGAAEWQATVDAVAKHLAEIVPAMS